MGKSEKKTNGVEELKKVFQKRNFYVTKDAGKVFLYALLLPLAVGLLFGYISIAIAKGTGINVEESTNVIKEMCEKFLWFSIPYMALTQIVFLIIYFGYNKFNRIEQKACNISFKKANVWTCLLSVLVGIISVFGFFVLIEGVFGNMFDSIGLLKSLNDSYQPPNNTVGFYFLNLLLLGIIPAIFEELLFRGIIFQGLRDRFKPLSSVLLTALLFALMHQSITQFIYPFILGVVLTIVMDKTNNLIYPIIIHFFNNFTTLTLGFLHDSGKINIGLIGMQWWWYLLGFVFAIVTVAIFFVIYKFYLIKKAKINVEKHGEAPLTNGISLGKFPLTMVIGIVVSLIMIVINAL